MNKLLYILSFILLLNSCQSKKGEITKSDKTELFDQVWNTVNEQFYDPNFNGIDWKSKYLEYEPLIENAENSDSLFSLLNKMLFELNSSHCGVGLLSELKNNVSPYLFMDGEIGIDIRIINNQIVITKVIQNSPAEKAQIKTGYIIEKLNDLSLADIEKLTIYKPPYNKRNKKFHLTAEVLRRIYGQAGTLVKIDYLGKNDSLQSNVLIRSKRKNSISLAEGMPNIFVESESYFITKDIAYLRFNVFQPTDLKHVLNHLERVNKAKGLIIDLRGNDGGSIEAMKLLLGRFVSERKKYGTYINRNENNEDFIESIGNEFAGNIVALVDEMSISGAENTAGILQQFKIAKIIGNQTPGQMLWGNGSIINDSIFLAVPIYRLEYPNGFNIENNGIKPDIAKELSRDDLLNEKDSQLEKAIEFLNLK